jgi:hypothetical protein
MLMDTRKWYEKNSPTFILCRLQQKLSTIHFFIEETGMFLFVDLLQMSEFDNTVHHRKETC